MDAPSEIPSVTDAQLISLAESVVALLESRSPDALNELERYVDCFSVWEAHRKRAGQESGEAIDPAAAEALRTIGERHAQVLALAEEMKDYVARSIRSLRSKGKGLRAYTDHFPKRISTIKTHKG